MAVLFRLWTKVKIFLVFVKLELPDVFLLPNSMKMTLKGALKFFIRLAEENFVIHVRVRVFCLLLYILEHSKCVFIYNKLIINKNIASIKYT
jgi:hypothetical protein